jgi:hypothetical protein
MNTQEHRKEYKAAWYQRNKNRILPRNKQYAKDHKDEIKKWLLENKEVRKNYNKEWNNKNRVKVKVRSKEWKQVNKDHIKEQRKQYYLKHKTEEIFKHNIYCKERRKTDINFKLKHLLRTRLSKAIGNNQKIGSAVKDLGCPISELKEHLEKQFQQGMCWSNWSHSGWHIDHIKPLSRFDLTDRQQFLEANHYTNLQPLWAKDNLSKSDHYESK